MDSILDKLLDKEIWEEFYTNRIEHGHLSRNEIKKLRDFIDSDMYYHTAKLIADGNCELSIPTLSQISKSGTAKKRIVYSFDDTEVWIMKLLCQLLYKYDNKLSPNCYSFRRGYNAVIAIKDILTISGLKKKYCLKADIHNYFNSIPANMLCGELEKVITDDQRLLDFLKNLLSKDVAMDKENNTLVYGNRGAMAGTPLSPFFANIYLRGVDSYFANEKILYFRYSDDILIFADTLNEISRYKEILLNMVSEKGLTINESKFTLAAPYESWEYLGFKYDNGIIDISDNTLRKIKGKIKRKAHSLYRWRLKKNTSFNQTARVMVRSFNKKFYDSTYTGDFSWAKWFFPVINSSEGLKKVDNYMILYLRYLNSGHHYKGNYKITYKQIKALGYRSLVNEYYKSKNQKQ